MSDVIDLGKAREKKEDNTAKYIFASLALCCHCMHRWVAHTQAETSLFKLECPACHEADSFASIIPSEYLHHFGVT